MTSTTQTLSDLLTNLGYLDSYVAVDSERDHYLKESLKHLKRLQILLESEVTPPNVETAIQEAQGLAL